ncbi:site-specific integrase [Acrocarpospora sp. B8E8]|uniref:tyrosine-type recombinase/integrase n=1 Tax=Acrocarpospora sp. B8E8 TaxID=3153572 RepID=UPI00325CCFED
MAGDEEVPRDLGALAVPLVGVLRETGDPWEPYRLLDPAGEPVEATAAFFRDLQASGRSESTVRSYAHDLLRWFRFLWAIETPWNQATRVEARDFCRWMLVAGKPARPHWRYPGKVPESAAAGAYAPSVRAHAETVLRSFYAFHLETGTGPIVNPFPLDRSRRGRGAHAHHNPMEPHRNERSGLFRPKVPSRVPRSIPDEEFNEIFARLPSHRDRALVAFYVSTGARASELLSATQGGVDPGRQLITVVRKGSGELQELPASSDAFVWLRLYQSETDKLIPKGRRQGMARCRTLPAGDGRSAARSAIRPRTRPLLAGRPGKPCRWQCSNGCAAGDPARCLRHEAIRASGLVGEVQPPGFFLSPDHRCLVVVGCGSSSGRIPSCAGTAFC